MSSPRIVITAESSERGAARRYTLRGTVVDLWIRASGSSGKAQRVSLDLLKPEAAGELVEGLPYTAPYPGSEPLAGRAIRVAGVNQMMWAAAVGAVVVIATLLVWALTRH